MARCEVCGRKIKGTQRMCGGESCKNTDKIIPRCLNCGGLVFDGRDCPATRQKCVVTEGTEALIPSIPDFKKKVK